MSNSNETIRELNPAELDQVGGGLSVGAGATVGVGATVNAGSELKAVSGLVKEVGGLASGLTDGLLGALGGVKI